MEAVFGTVLLAIVLVAAAVALLSYVGSGRIYEQLGKGDLALDEPDRPPAPVAGGPAAHAEAQAEIRQMLEARNARRARNGQEPVDVEAELARLTSPAHRAGVDPALRDEVHQMVVARNARRARRGQEPLDVEVEIERQLRELG